MLKRRIFGCLMALALLLAGCGASAAQRYAEQLELGTQYLLELDYEQAIAAFTAAIEIDANQPDAYLGRADAYLAQASYAEAVSDYGAALALNSDLAPAYRGRGDAFFAQGDHAAALTDYLATLELEPGQGPVLARVGDLYFEQGNFAEAAQSYEAALQAGPGDNVDLAQLYLQLGQAWLELGDVDKAVEAFAQGYAATGSEELGALQAEYERVVWDDAVFEQMIRQTLELPDGPVYAHDLDGVTMIQIMGSMVMLVGDENTEWEIENFFYATQGDDNYEYGGDQVKTGQHIESDQRGGITSIAALRYFRNLQQVVIWYNQIRDISVINEMEQLQRADFALNPVEDRSPLERFR